MSKEIPKEFQELAENWNHPHVLHRDIYDFSGGAVSRTRLATFRMKGKGPKSFRIGNKAVSGKWDMARWLHDYTKRLEK